jgi:hypothetical protein
MTMRTLRFLFPRRGGGMTRLALAATLLLCGVALTPAAARAQDDIMVCAGQPVPAGYAVVRAFRGDQCPNYYQGTHNMLTIRVPGDTVTVCAEFTTELSGYVVTGRFRSDACPNYYASTPNGAQWRRLAAAAPQPQDLPPPGYDRDGVEIMEGLDEYGRYVQRQMRAVVGRLGLAQATHLPWAGAAPLNGYERLRVYRQAGEPLTLVAVCDQDCDEIVLRVMAPDGAVAAAGQAGPESVVRLPAAAQPGGWTVQATIRACTAEFCRFAVGVYQTPPDPGIPPRRPPPQRPAPRP